MSGASVTTNEAVRKARFEKLWEAVDVAATTLATAIDALPTSVQDRALRRAVGNICRETNANDPFAALNDQPNLDAILRGNPQRAET